MLTRLVLFSSVLRSEFSYHMPDLELFDHERPKTIIRTRSGRFVRVSLEPELTWRLLTSYEVSGDAPGAARALIDQLVGDGLAGPREPLASGHPVLELFGDEWLRQRFFKITSKSIFANQFQGVDGDSKTIAVLLLAASDWIEQRRFERVARTARSQYTTIVLENRSLFVGPFLAPNDALTYRDVFDRQLCAHHSYRYLRLEIERPAFGGAIVDDEALDAALSVAALQISRWGRGHSRVPTWTQVEISLETGQQRSHPILPLPKSVAAIGQNGTAANVAAFGIDAGVDSRFGIVMRVEEVKSACTQLSYGIHMALAQAAETSRVVPFDVSTFNCGFSLNDPEEAKIIAIAETLERYSGAFWGQRPLVRGSYASLTLRGMRAMDPHSFCLFSSEQYASARFPYAPFDAHFETDWVEMNNMSSGESAWMPASLVFLGWWCFERIADLPLHPENYVGISAGRTAEHALTNALEEVIERDATMTWWLKALTAPRIVPPPSMIPLLANAAAGGYSAKFLLLPHEFEAPVVAAIVEGEALGTMTVGFACRNSVEAATVKAWMEAVAIQDTLAGLRDPLPAGGVSAPRGIGSFGLAAPRVDRAYRLAYADDFSDVNSLFAQLQLSCDPVIAKLIKERLDADGEEELPIDRFPQAFPRAHTEYLNRIVAAGFDCWSCDLTTSDVELLGIRVVRVVVPGLLMNFPTAYPPLGSPRALADRPVGCQIDGRQTPQSFYALPLPYA